MEGGSLTLGFKPIQGHPDATLVVVGGSLDPASLPRFTAEMDAAVQRGACTFILDAEGLTYINSLGLAYLIGLNDTVSKKRGHIALAGLQENVAVVFRMMGLLEIFRSYPTYVEALMGLAEPAESGEPALKAEVVAPSDDGLVVTPPEEATARLEERSGAQLKADLDDLSRQLEEATRLREGREGDPAPEPAATPGRNGSPPAPGGNPIVRLFRRLFGRE